MKVIASTGREDVAVVYIMELSEGRKIECVESLKPPIPMEKKWVLLVSTIYGCPVKCKFCDAGDFYKGMLSKQDMFDQIDFMVDRHFPDRIVTPEQFKIQFARMGEPLLNPAVLEVLDELPFRYKAPGLMPSLSTIAPAGAAKYFEPLLEIKKRHYNRGNFQFQFSIHTTDQQLRDKLIPVKKWSFTQMAEYGERFYQAGDRKITLNFALAKDQPADPDVLLRFFDPEKFLVKITPLNPTYRAVENGLSTYIDPHEKSDYLGVIENIKNAGYDIALSIGEPEENYIGSNCGQYLKTHMNSKNKIEDGYRYQIVNQEKVEQTT